MRNSKTKATTNSRKKPTKTPAKPSVWNKGKVVGAKKPLDIDQLNGLRRILKDQGATRDLALLETHISTMLRASDVLALTVGDVVDHRGEIVSELVLAQEKTDKPIRVQLGDRARAALETWIVEAGKGAGDHLFTAKTNHHGPAMSHQAYHDIVKRWARLIHVNPSALGTHSLRRTMAAHIYKRTGNLRSVQLLLGHSSLAATERYLGVEVEDALELARKYQI